MQRQELVQLVRSHIDQLKQLDVPNLMRAGNIERLIEIEQKFDFSGFTENQSPKFTVEELLLQGSDDLLATIFYIWSHPFVVNDCVFFDDPEDFLKLLQKETGKLEKKLAHNIEYYVINKDAFSIEHLLGIEKS